VKKFLRTPKGTLTAIFVVLLAVAGTATPGFGALAAATARVAQLMGAGQAYLLIGVLVPNAALAAWRIIGNPRPARLTLARNVAVESTSAGTGAGVRRGV
jgi:hypothetical protein